MNYNQWVSSSTYLFISARNPSVVSSSLRLIKCPVSLWNMKTGQQPSRTVWPCFLFYSVIYLMSLVVQFFLSFFFFCDLEQSTVQLFRELSNPPSDLSRAARPNRIVVLTLMTIPPAVAEPPVGHQEECVGGGPAERQRGRWLTDRERQTQMDRDREWVYVMLLVSCGITLAAAQRRNTETLKCFTFGRLPLQFYFSPLC